MSALITDVQRVALAARTLKTDVDMLQMAAEDAIEEGADFARIKPALDQARRDLGDRWNDLRKLANP